MKKIDLNILIGYVVLVLVAVSTSLIGFYLVNKFQFAVNVWNFENENMGRRCRELCEEGIIERIGDGKGRSQYRYKPVDTLFPLREIENKINFID